MSEQALFEVRHVHKEWRGLSAPVLDSVDLALQPAGLVWLSGANGVGKTTLLRVSAGLIKPDAGTVRCGRFDPFADRESFQRRVGLLSAASDGLYARLTARMHLELWARLALLSKEAATAGLARVAELFALDELLDRRMDRMSMGQRQRVRLAGVFLPDPLVLLLDEPANSLDDVGRSQLTEAVARTTERGGGALWCSPQGEAPPAGATLHLELQAGRLERAA